MIKKTELHDFCEYLEYPLQTNSLIFNVENRLLAIAEGSVITLWNLGITLKEEKSFELEKKDLIYSTAFNKTGQLAVGTSEGDVIVWDINSEEKLMQCREHGGTVFSVIFSLTEEQLVSGSEDGTIKFWDIKNKKSTYSIDTCAAILSLSWDQTFNRLSERFQKVDGSENKYLASGHNDNSVRYWRVLKVKSGFSLQLLWSSHSAGLNLQNANIEEALMSRASFNLLRQRGAKNKPKEITQAQLQHDSKSTTAASTSLLWKQPTHASPTSFSSSDSSVPSLRLNDSKSNLNVKHSRKKK